MNKLKLTLSLFAAVMFTVGASAQSVDDVNAKFNEAGAKLQAKDFAAAIPLFEEVVSLGTQVGADAAETVTQAQKYLPMCFFYNGMAQAKENQFEAALASFTQAQEKGELYGDLKTSRNAAQMIGQSYMAMGGNAYNAKDYAKAAEIFAKGYAAAPNNTKLGLYLADSYDKLDSLNKAIDVYKSIIALEQKHSRYAEDANQAKKDLTLAMLARASKAAEANNLDEVVQYTGVILEYDPSNEIATLLRVQTANNNKNYKAVTEYGDAAAEAQTDAVKKSDAYFLLGAAYQNLDNKAKAIEAFKKVTAGANVAAAKQLVTDLSK